MKRLVIVGTGGRGTSSYAGTILQEFENRVEIAGIFDPNHKRMQACNTILGVDLPMFSDFDQMLETVKPDGVIVWRHRDTGKKCI